MKYASDIEISEDYGEYHIRYLEMNCGTDAPYFQAIITKDYEVIDSSIWGSDASKVIEDTRKYLDSLKEMRHEN